MEQLIVNHVLFIFHTAKITDKLNFYVHDGELYLNIDKSLGCIITIKNVLGKNCRNSLNYDRDNGILITWRKP